MAEHVSEGLEYSGEAILSVPNSSRVRPNPLSRLLSGISLNQNGRLAGWHPLETFSQWTWQTFHLQADFPIGATGEENARFPEMCGFELNVTVASGHAPSAALDWAIEYWHPTNGWTGVAKGTSVGAPGDGEGVWFKVDFEPVDISFFWWRKFRLGVHAHRRENPILRLLVPYDSEERTVTIANERINIIPDISPAPLIEGKQYIFEHGEVPSLLEITGGDAFYSTLHGIESLGFSAPNPFGTTVSKEFVTAPTEAEVTAHEEIHRIEQETPFAVHKSSRELSVTSIERTIGGDIKAYEGDGISALTSLIDGASRELSLRFRILTTAPDTDRDCTGSRYRTVALVSDPAGIRTSVGELQDAYWLSAPNPSQFACESLYFDISNGDQAQVVDHLIIDPVTPGVWMNIYYSNDELPGEDTESWDGLLWTRVPKHFLLRRKETFAMPEPITAKYIKLEFTHLQPVWYAPGTFQLPMQYRKHPKWVLDYYLSLYQDLRGQELEHASAINVTYDALDLAYLYYLDDIRQDSPNAPATVQSSEGVSLLSNLLLREQETELNRVDPQTLIRIRTNLKPFATQPAQQGGFGTLLQQVINRSVENGNYPVESVSPPISLLSNVSSADRDSLIVEKQFPVTSFYLTCRHYYMVSSARFKQDRAYFAGVKEVTFTREHYASRFDNPLYIETTGDNLSVETNDFQTSGDAWVTYTTS